MAPTSRYKSHKHRDRSKPESDPEEKFLIKKQRFEEEDSDLEKSTKYNKLGVDYKKSSSSSKRRRRREKGLIEKNDGASRGEVRAKHEEENSVFQDEMHNSDTGKKDDKLIHKRRDGYGDRDWMDDVNKADERQMSSRDYNSKRGSYKDELYQEKYRQVLDRDQMHYDDKYRDERSSRTHSERSYSKHYSDEIRLSDKCDKKTKDNDRDGNHRAYDQSTKFKENRGRKRFADEIEDNNDVKPRCLKEPREDNKKYGLSSSKFECKSHSNRGRLEDPHDDKVDFCLSSTQEKVSPHTSAVKDENRHNSSQAEAIDTHCSAPGVQERISSTRSSEKDESSVPILSKADSTHCCDNIPRSDSHTSLKQIPDIFSSSTTETRPKKIAAQLKFDMQEAGQRNQNFKCRSGTDNLNGDNIFQIDLLKREHVSVGHHAFPPPFPSKTETRTQNVEWKMGTRYKRSSGIPWRSPAPTWPSPVPNNFRPPQHGPAAGFVPVPQQFPAPSPVRNNFRPLQQGPTVGFHPVPQEDPAPPLYGVRPSMDSSNTAYLNLDYTHLYGSHTSKQVWSEDIIVCGGQKLTQNSHTISSQNWEMNANTWSRHNKIVNMEISVPQKEHECSWQPGQFAHDELARLEKPVVADTTGIKLSSDTSIAKQSSGVATELVSEKIPEPSKMPTVKADNNVYYYSTYLSKLDISIDLTQPELYKQCMSIMVTREGNDTVRIPSWRQLKRKTVGPRLGAKNKHAFNSLFPTTSNIFQKAMSLYKKQKEATSHFAYLDGKRTNPPKTTNIEELANTVWDDYMVEDENIVAIAKANADDKQYDMPTDTNARLVVNSCDKFFETAAFVEERREAIISDCGVNLTRIHSSPENTH